MRQDDAVAARSDHPYTVILSYLPYPPLKPLPFLCRTFRARRDYDRAFHAFLSALFGHREEEVVRRNDHGEIDMFIYVGYGGQAMKAQHLCLVRVDRPNPPYS
ncbi:MAG: hypothetical protein A4E64_01186 [Syntrophorhabdus sp. PtaU1.Bin058]|nr:MAG: hypothetical protein A4E64_01186 [Syntrophorhabdus sp. PtaU1.Bin058]